MHLPSVRNAGSYVRVVKDKASQDNLLLQV